MGATAHRSTGRGRARRLLRPQRCGCQHGGGTAALKRGAVAVNIGALTEPLAIQPIRFMTGRLQPGFELVHDGEGRLMAEMAKVGVLDLSMLETRAYPCEGQ